MKYHVEIKELLSVGHVEVDVERKQRMYNRSTSRGSQVKWVKGDLFVKLDTKGCYESLSETFVTYLLKCSNVKEYVEYERCRIYDEGKYLGIGCCSKSFLKDGEKDISFYRILKN